MRTLQELAKEVLQSQNASNSSGVALGMHRALCDLRLHYPNTDIINRHPITILWIDKLASLAAVQSLVVNINDAYAYVEKLASEGNKAACHCGKLETHSYTAECTPF